MPFLDPQDQVLSDEFQRLREVIAADVGVFVNRLHEQNLKLLEQGAQILDLQRQLATDAGNAAKGFPCNPFMEVTAAENEPTSSPAPQTATGSLAVAASTAATADEPPPLVMVNGGMPEHVCTEETSVPINPEKASVKKNIPDVNGSGAFQELHASEKVALDEEVYKVENFYFETGIAQLVARSDLFQSFTLCVISANGIYIGVDEDHNDSDASSSAKVAFRVIENLFCMFFVFELSTRFMAFRKKRDCMLDNWFKFDLILVMLMILETWIMPIIFDALDFTGKMPTGPLRLLRLLRLSRLARLMRFFPELMTMVKAMRAALRAVSSSLAMVLILIYAFGIVLHMVMKEVDSGLDLYFSSVPLCMWSLLIHGTLLDSPGAIMNAMRTEEKAQAWINLTLFLIFVFLSALTLMNMLIGVLCEVVSSVSIREKDEAAINGLKDTVLSALKKYDTDGNKMISQPELLEVLENEDAALIIEALDIDHTHLMDMQAMMYSKKSEISMDEIMEMLLFSRGNVPTTFRQMSENHLLTRWTLNTRLDLFTKKMETYMMKFGNMMACQKLPYTDGLTGSPHTPLVPKEGEACLSLPGWQAGM
eukprot:NODE_3193_length_2076_cov_16.446383.p1 GENE.NODE_3193_length_2076_cov_16.446383~~NODE_3193_length_2076_cov_16.446383.p1  ORF type:complete len:593 (+),score=162.48 NODE_3193_length_2076_cov_16.446383:123-1901(+)